MSQFNGVLQYKISSPAFSCLQYNNCIAIQFSSLTNLPLLSQYNCCIVTQNQSILTPLSHYNLGSSPTDSATPIFFFQLFPATRKCPKNYIHPFFFLQYTPNKFMTIYFIHFSLTLHTIKLLEKYFFSSYKFFFFHISSY